jgi:hydroxymethylpyrimidine pyrophosphatase-like HAD family hydrolase
MESRDRATLATDLDGTLIPLEDDRQGEQYQALRELEMRALAGSFDLIFVTGRHRESVWRVTVERHLPRPSWLICDVGTTLLQTKANESPTGHLATIGATESLHALAPNEIHDSYKPVLAYEQHLERLSAGVSANDVAERLSTPAGLTLQEPEKQGRFKLSFYCDSLRLVDYHGWLEAWLERQSLAYRVVSSIDPFNQDGLIDLLPHGCDKAAALQWWLQYTGRSANSVVYAGDSGNDLAALTSEFRSIVVGNATPGLISEVQAAHARRGSLDQLYIARAAATAGVLEGCRWFQLL